MARNVALLLLLLLGVLHCQSHPHSHSVYYNRYGNTRNFRFGLPISPACQGHLPCYDITINYIIEGKPSGKEVPEEYGAHFRHFASYGLNRQQIIAQGRRALAYFKTLYGVDLTYLPDAALLSGHRTFPGGIEFRPITFGVSGQGYRLYTASTKTDAQIFNRPISEAGWRIVFTKEYQSNGTFTQLIPAGARNIYGSQVTFPCGRPTQNTYPGTRCRNILNPYNPWAPIVIYFRKPTYLRRFSEPSSFTFLNAILEHEVWGTGEERGITLNTPERSSGRISLTFPSYL